MYEFGQAEIDAVVRTLQRKKLFRYLEGEKGEADQFEEECSHKFEVAHTLLVSSGTAGLICGLAAMGIGPGDEVIIPGYTYVATALAPLAVGAVPVLCEINDSLTLDPAALEQTIGPKTRAVIPVHMHGFPCDMQAISAIAKHHQIFVLEDACQAIGGKYQGKCLGTLGDMGIFSFHQNKILTAGEGGAILTNNRTLYERAFIQHDGTCDDGSCCRDFAEPLFAGWAFRASELSAAILRVQLRRLDAILEDFAATKARVTDRLSHGSCDTPIPCYDPDGECGTHAAYQFATPAEAQAFCQCASRTGLYAVHPGTSKYNYIYWNVLSLRRGALHPLRDPFRNTERTYDHTTCPRTLDLLSRTALLACTWHAQGEALEKFVECLAQARQEAHV
ncbi:aminotransferase class V-fold PLP-dependent enzyme [candidate division KSB3 bacterium]|uniref:Aminotransferase class V-fold PLP-dependent enzyme n=1 Tax=candidate division KSB3 bacterium TaxID=2044937 RepID=A0A9D5Q6A0_9BACT|nr:aminotransferase class V-fold PLP-dependent enzyme [candidate division KSB3 bacterium]MBD3325619.1 aminotransferase class V-fold PLP-dependent enzyme [candidate division KSB3 bacterium]